MTTKYQARPSPAAFGDLDAKYTTNLQAMRAARQLCAKRLKMHNHSSKILVAGSHRRHVARDRP